MKCSNPSCSSQGLVCSSCNETFLSVSGGQRSRKGPFCTTTVCKRDCVFSNMYGFVSFLITLIFFPCVLGFKIKFVCCICYDIYRNTCGQTSCPVVWTEIQTCRNTKASRRSNNFILDCWIFRLDWSGLREKRYCHQRHLFFLGSFITSPRTKSSLRRTNKREDNSTQHRKKQKDGYQHFVGAVDISCLLFVSWRFVAVSQICKWNRK